MAGVLTQGDPDSDDNFVETYQVQYTPDNETWINITDEDGNVVVRTIPANIYLCPMIH